MADVAKIFSKLEFHKKIFMTQMLKNRRLRKNGECQ